MSGKLPAFGKNINSVHPKQYRYLLPCVASRYRVAILVDDDCGIFINLADQGLQIAENHRRHRQHMVIFSFVENLYRVLPACHLVTAVGIALLKQLGVELFDACRLGNRNHIIAPGKAYKPFNSTFLVTGSRVGKAGIKTVVDLKFAKRFLLSTVPAM